MKIEKRSLVIGTCVGLIFMAVVGLVNIILNEEKLNELENEVLQRESTIRELENLNAQLEEELEIQESAITELEYSILFCEENCCQLQARIKDLEMNISAQASIMQLLDEAVHTVGQEDIGELLWAYTEVSLKYEELQREYEELLSK